MSRPTPTAESPDRGLDRRAFVRGLGITGATAVAGGALFTGRARAASGDLEPGDAAILRFLAAAELIETDLWEQYADLAGVDGGNPGYQAALSNVDDDMPTYITRNTKDEQSHAAFLNAYLVRRGAQPVDLEPFRTLPSTAATGGTHRRRLTSLQSLNVDTSFYTRYRSSVNPDLGASFPQAITINRQPAIPISDADTPPGTPVPVPATTPAARRLQVMACVAVFHFAFIEQGGSSLYATLADQVSDSEVLRVVSSIGGVEDQHFAVWHDDAGDAASAPIAPVTDPVTGLTIPNLNHRDDPKLFATNRIFPRACQFIDSSLPECSVVRPTSPRLAGARAAVAAFTDDGLFTGQSAAFLSTLDQLAHAADAATRP
jgi:hypothetical protein